MNSEKFVGKDSEYDEEAIKDMAPVDKSESNKKDSKKKKAKK